MTTAVEICGCSSCKCEVKPHEGIARHGHVYCSEDCAMGHSSQKGCGHGDCCQ